MRYRVRPSGPLRGRVNVPGDKSIGHRALIFGALASGTSTVQGLSGGKDNAATAGAFRAMGVELELDETSARIRGVGVEGLRMPLAPLDCGNSGTTMRLLAGLLSAQRFGSTLTGDASLTRRPMGRVAKPLRARGAHIAGRSGAKADEVYPPLSIAPLVDAESLLGLEYDMPVASAQVKSALLLAGLYASGPTLLREPVVSRDHTERMLTRLGVPIETSGPMVALDPSGWERGWDGFDWFVPGDLSSAAFLVAASQLVPGSEIIIDNVGTNPTRTGLLDAIRAMRGNVQIVPKGDDECGEPIAEIHATHEALTATSLGGELLVRMIDEVPAFCAMAAVARGRSELRDAAELRVKESDRLSAMAEVLQAFSIPVSELDDGLIIEGARIRGRATLRSHGDHRIAMTSAIMALAGEGESIIEDVDCVETSFPGFAALLRSLGADIVEEEDRS